MLPRLEIQKGFTLIELIVVIAIIGILAAIVMVGLNEARKDSRDSNRAVQMQEIIKAFELYYTDNGVYPDTPGSSDPHHVALESVSELVDNNHIKRIPDDPHYADPAEGYRYCSENDRGYILFINVEYDDADDTWCYIERGFGNAGCDSSITALNATVCAF